MWEYPARQVLATKTRPGVGCEAVRLGVCETVYWTTSDCSSLEQRSCTGDSRVFYWQEMSTLRDQMICIIEAIWSSYALGFCWSELKEFPGIVILLEHKCKYCISSSKLEHIKLYDLFEKKHDYFHKDFVSIKFSCPVLSACDIFSTLAMHHFKLIEELLKYRILSTPSVDRWRMHHRRFWTGCLTTQWKLTCGLLVLSSS